MSEWIYEGSRWRIAGGCLKEWNGEEWLRSREVAPLVVRCLALEAEVERLKSGERERQIALLAEVAADAIRRSSYSEHPYQDAIRTKLSELRRER